MYIVLQCREVVQKPLSSSIRPPNPPRELGTLALTGSMMRG